MAKVRINQSAKHIAKNYVSAGGLLFSTGFELVGRVSSGEKLSLSTIGKSVVSGVGWELIHPGAAAAYGLASLAVAGGAAAYNSVRKQQQKWKDNRQTGMRATYADSEQALTMRQAAVQAIQGSRMNARNALGGEASMMHRKWTR
jgi:hypothetical protein